MEAIGEYVAEKIGQRHLYLLAMEKGWFNKGDITPYDAAFYSDFEQLIHLVSQNRIYTIGSRV